MSSQLFPTPPPMTERQWQTTIQGALKREGYRWQHVFRSRMQDGNWRTTTTAIGWPDLMAFRRGWVLGIEVKSGPKARVRPEQIDWLTEIAVIPTGRAWLLSPADDWQAIANWIHDPESAPRLFGWSFTGVHVDGAPAR